MQASAGFRGGQRGPGPGLPPCSCVWPYARHARATFIFYQRGKFVSRRFYRSSRWQYFTCILFDIVTKQLLHLLFSSKSCRYLTLVQLCPTRSPVEGFARPTLGFAVVKVVYILTTCRYFDVIFNLTSLMQVVLSAILSRLLPLQLWFEGFQYIRWAKFSLLDQSKPFNVPLSLICHAMCGPGWDSDMIFGSVSHLGWTYPVADLVNARPRYVERISPRLYSLLVDFAICLTQICTGRIWVTLLSRATTRRHLFGVHVHFFHEKCIISEDIQNCQNILLSTFLILHSYSGITKVLSQGDKLR